MATLTIQQKAVQASRQNCQEMAQSRIDHIQEMIDIMQAAINQEKADIDKLSWLDVGDLGHVDELMTEIVRFWQSGGR